MSQESAHEHGNRLYLIVWGGLLLLTIVEIILAYMHLTVMLMLITLMSLSVIKAGLIMAYFMHLRFEKFSLVVSLIPALVICICLFAAFFPDSVRILEMGLP